MIGWYYRIDHSNPKDLSISLSMYYLPAIHQSIYLPIILPICLSVYLPIILSIFLLSIICLSTHLAIHPSIHPSYWLFLRRTLTNTKADGWCSFNIFAVGQLEEITFEWFTQGHRTPSQEREMTKGRALLIVPSAPCPSNPAPDPDEPPAGGTWPPASA